MLPSPVDLAKDVLQTGLRILPFPTRTGLIRIGNPGRESPVLLTCNFDLTVRRLRRALRGLDCFLLVAPSRGINVWCAAGKGSFGTAALCAQIEANKIGQLVRHRKLVVPQLGAPGIAAHAVKRQSGFAVVYGPVMARHLPDFLRNGMKATQEMRRKTFPLAERVVLLPLEFVIAGKWALLLSLVVYGLSGFFGPAPFSENVGLHGSFAVAGLWSGILAGTIITPLFLPVLPGRAFSLKGAVAGFLAALIFLAFLYSGQGSSGDIRAGLAWLLLIPAIASFLGMEFTGASTYTSLSGVKKEMRLAMPLQIVAGICGLFLLAWSWRL